MSLCLMSKTGHECFKNILDQFPVPVIIAGFGVGKIFYINEHAKNLLRTEGGGVEFVNTTDFYVDPRKRGGFLDLISSVGFVKEYEVEFKDSFGARFWGMVSSKKIVYDGNDAILSTVIDISLRKKLEEDLLCGSSHDYMTGVFNRRHFSSVLNSEAARSKRYETELSMIMFDLDDFKLINDAHGHVVGDEVLKHFCSLVQDNLRQTDAIGRVGGEEFAVMLPETGLDGAKKLADRIRKSVQETEYTFGKISISLTISAGVAEIIKSEGADELYKRCDDALLVAKTTGKNKVVTAKSRCPGL